MLDLYIQDLIVQNNIRVPVIHIKDNLFLLGSQRASCDLKNDNVVVRVGGGMDRFVDYMTFNHRAFERQLVNHMVNSAESLEWVVEQLMANRKIKGGILPQLTGSPVRASSPANIRLPRTNSRTRSKSPGYKASEGSSPA